MSASPSGYFYFTLHIKKSLREKLGAPLPTINRFEKQIQKEFGTQTAINNDAYYTFLDTYYGTVDWDAEW